MVSLNLSEEPNFIRPALLLHPMIPHSLSGVNPRRLKGKEWWDETRKAAYAANNYCCWACGAHRMDTEEQLLDGHETYGYDFKRRVTTYTETVALCRPCHEFIHFNVLRSGRLTRRLMRGFVLLRGAEIALPYPQANAAMYLGYGKVPSNAKEHAKVGSLLARRWTLKFDHKLFKGRRRR